jgi:signal transduction histidine kinase
MFTTKPFGEATGLGLTIVHHAVTGEFGGTIDVESREGAGTKIRIRFPKV